MTGEARFLALFGSALYLLMGSVHCLMALRDDRRELIFMRSNESLRQTLLTTPVWFARRVSMLSTLHGVNLSHGVGVTIYGLMTFYLLWSGIGDQFSEALLGFSMIFALVYLAVSLRYWMGLPALGYGVGSGLFLAACLIQWI